MNGVRGALVTTALTGVWLLAAAQTIADEPMGLGMVKPPISVGHTLYFYGIPALDPSAQLPAPIDSLTFARGEYYIDIATAPPWFEPEVLKLDYDLLFLRAVSLRAHWIEVIVNRTTGQTAWLDRHGVEYSDWTSFLLGVFSVDVLDAETNPVRVRPFAGSDVVVATREGLYPMTIRGSWMQVGLDMDYARTGWIKWREGDRLLVAYSLLS